MGFEHWDLGFNNNIKMTTVGKRREKVLELAIRDYIRTAQPISSAFLSQRHHFGLSSATLRSDMHFLTEEKYFYQPHCSSGRIPTDKGYRFFVDKLTLKLNAREGDALPNELSGLRKEESSFISFVQSLTKSLADCSLNLVLSYLPEDNFLAKDGWGKILFAPEFRDSDFLYHFSKMVEKIEESINSLVSRNYPDNVDTYIGEENPFYSSKEFSIIVCKREWKREGKRTISLMLGPKRMLYARNINLMESITKF